jgi:hypothetical protein
LQDIDPDRLLFLHEVKSLYVGVTRVKRNLIFFESTESMEARIFQCLLVNARERGIFTEDVFDDGSHRREALLVVLKSSQAVKKYLSGFSIQGDSRTREEEAKEAEASGNFDEAAKLFFQNGNLFDSALCTHKALLMGGKVVDAANYLVDQRRNFGDIRQRVRLSKLAAELYMRKDVNLYRLAHEQYQVAWNVESDPKKKLELHNQMHTTARKGIEHLLSNESTSSNESSLFGGLEWALNEAEHRLQAANRKPSDELFKTYIRLAITAIEKAPEEQRLRYLRLASQRTSMASEVLAVACVHSWKKAQESVLASLKQLSAGQGSLQEELFARKTTVDQIIENVDCCLELGSQWSCWADCISLLQNAHETLGQLCLIKRQSLFTQDTCASALLQKKTLQSGICRLLLLFKMTCSDEATVSRMSLAVSRAPPLITKGGEVVLASRVTQELSALCKELSKKGNIPAEFVLHTCTTAVCRCESLLLASRVASDSKVKDAKLTGAVTFEAARLSLSKSVKEKSTKEKLLAAASRILQQENDPVAEFFNDTKRTFIKRLPEGERVSTGALFDELSKNAGSLLVQEIAKLIEVDTEFSEQQAILKERDRFLSELEDKHQQYVEQCGLMLHSKLCDSQAAILCLCGVRELRSSTARVVLELLQGRGGQRSVASDDSILQKYLSIALSKALLGRDKGFVDPLREAATLLFSASARYICGESRDPESSQAKIQCCFRVASRLARTASSRYKVRMVEKAEAVKEEKGKDDETAKAGFYYLLTSLQQVVAYLCLHDSDIRASIAGPEREGKCQEAVALEDKLATLYKERRASKEQHDAKMQSAKQAILALESTETIKDKIKDSEAKLEKELSELQMKRGSLIQTLKISKGKRQ